MIPRRRIELDWRDWVGRPEQAPAVTAFETAFARFSGCSHARATASGRAALLTLLDALGLGPGDEIIIPAYTLGELLPLLQGRGLRIVAADVDPASFNLTPRGLAARLGPHTRAVIAVHLFGAPADLDGLLALTRPRGIPLIEDCAHAHGARLAGRPAGSLGTAGFFSLEVNKPVATFGGGLLVCNDAGLARAVDARLSDSDAPSGAARRKAVLKSLEECLVRSPLYGPAARLLFGGHSAGHFDRFYRAAHDRVRPQQAGYSDFQARIGLRRLEQLPERNHRLNALWRTLAAQLPEGFTPQYREGFGTPAAYNFVARYAGDPARLRRAALAAGLDLGIGREVMDDTAALLGQQDCPQAAALFRSTVLIPFHAAALRDGGRVLLQRLQRAARAAD